MNPAGIEIRDNKGSQQVVCVECGRWVRTVNERIRHANYCESKAQPQAEAPVAAAPRDRFVAAAREGQAALCGDHDELVKAVRGHFVSVNDAMNQDF